MFRSYQALVDRGADISIDDPASLILDCNAFFHWTKSSVIVAFLLDHGIKSKYQWYLQNISILPAVCVEKAFMCMAIMKTIAKKNYEDEKALFHKVLEYDVERIGR